MCVLNGDVKFKGYGGVLIITAALNKILQGHENVLVFSDRPMWLLLLLGHSQKN